ncbi:MAG: pyrroline-5-carboxylate reductase [Clostridia bacterium]|nr:pyrroline-5-carboxylate reductase [Clostridia bacterium]
MMCKTISFIGTGNMAYAIISGLTADNSPLPVSKSQITLFDTNIAQYDKFKGDFNISETIHDAVKSDIIFLAVKPQNYAQVLGEISGINYDGKIIISIAAGISIGYIESFLGKCAVVRTMPNTPLLVGKGLTALCRNKNVSDEDFDLIEKIFAASGTTIRIDESEMNRIIPATSSSPAYVFLFIKAICDTSTAQGLKCDDLRRAVCDAVIGSATLARESELSLEELIRMVTSPKGTTEQAMNVFKNQNFEGIIDKAMEACLKRADELSKL